MTKKLRHQSASVMP